MTISSPTPARVLAVSLGYLVVLGAGIWAASVVVGTPIAGADAAGWLAPLMAVAAVAGWIVVTTRLPADAGVPVRLLVPALGAGLAFLLAGVVLHGLGSGDPLKGPGLALAQFGHPSFYLAVGLAVVASAVVSMGSPPRRGTRGRPIG
ncbi:MAG: hypothetical protein ABWX65_01145 [Mycetocola sp.]